VRSAHHIGAVALFAGVLWAGQSWAQGMTAGHNMSNMSMPDTITTPSAQSRPTTVNLGPLSPAAPPSAAHIGDHESLYGAVLIDQLEYRGGSGSNIGAWEGQAYYGGDYNKVWINTRGEYNSKARALERAEAQVLYSRLISYFFNAQAGVRQDIGIRPNEGTPARTHLVLGIEGLLPNLFEANFQFFVDHRGTVAARFEGSYDAYLTQRLVLQPQVEINAAANSDPQSRLGSGFTRLETGLRLRYEVTREFAPYIGVQYERVLGETANIYKRAGEERELLSAVAGVRLFF
jgi:copper resistance protein B